MWPQPEIEFNDIDGYISQGLAEELAQVADEGDIYRGQLFECWRADEGETLTLPQVS